MNQSTLTSPSPADFLAPRSKRRPAWVAALLVVALLFGGVAASRWQRHEAAVKFSAASTNGKPVVSTQTSTVAPDLVDLTLPSNTEAVVVADIYARANGYVKARYANIGDRVHAGQLLAQIEAPELDQDLARARATVEESRAAWRQAQANVSRAEEAVVEARARLDQSQANEALAKATSTRWTRLVEKGVLPRQEGDERQYAYTARRADAAASEAAIRTAQATVAAAQASVNAAQATVRANEANVSRLERLVAYERVVAPFDGIITERLVEQGDLIAAGGVDGGRKLFAIAQPGIIRVQVNVPQTFATELKEGQQTQVTVRERPGRAFAGKIARTANSLNPASRTLLVEVQIDNPQLELLPGMFAEVKFAIPRTHPATLIPADALLADAQGTRVAAVGADRRIRFHKVEVGRDLGTHIELTAGLAPGQSVIVNPGEMLAEGQEVALAPAAPPAH